MAGLERSRGVSAMGGSSKEHKGVFSVVVEEEEGAVVVRVVGRAPSSLWLLIRECHHGRKKGRVGPLLLFFS